ncbi:MAG: hypothetical protein KDA78_16655 [Planctomycetaceae bacterium]|nr:hypothetical protein [Planctomycetaceae bacterium]
MPATEWRYLGISSAALLGIVLIINWGYAVFLTRYEANFGKYQVDYKWSLIQQPDRECQVLILGDSSGDQGVVPEIIYKNTGLTALNTCTFGDLLLVDDVWMLERYLELHQPPRYLVLVHVYDIWSRGNPETGSLQQIPLSIASWRQRSSLGLIDWKWLGQVWLNQQLPIISRRYTLDMFRKDPFVFFDEYSITRHAQRYDSFGFRACQEAMPEMVRKDREDHLEQLKEQKETLSDLNRSAFARLVDLCQQNQIRLVVFNSPLDAELAGSDSFQEYSARLRSLLNIEVKQLPLDAIVDEIFKVSPSELERVDHVTRPAAERYTMFVAEKLNELERRAPSLN